MFTCLHYIRCISSVVQCKVSTEHVVAVLFLKIECKHHFRSHDARCILGHSEAHSAGLRNWIREDGVSSSGETAREKLSKKQAETMELSRNGVTHQQNIRKQALLSWTETRGMEIRATKRRN